uniref:Uncharacterized protein n=2 Tax=unclassified Caudoviricetes TaxID=2788787 RepID=A0A8S5PNT5_9CAUD|nr:MAG TPA: hypothetical protein [Siphoviridae sp. ctdoa10]DAE08823.1 MAG TPA: hypothetical protein [Siphoviridae sp. ctAiL5]
MLGTRARKSSRSGSVSVQQGRARTTKVSLNAPTRSGDQGSTRARYVTSQRTISSSLLSWTN